MSGPVLLAKDLRKVYGKGKQPSSETVSLSDLNLRVDPGQFVALVGPDGAGKTTLMRLAACLLTPTSGSLEVFGILTTENPLEIQKKLAYMPQKFGLYEDLSVKENMDLFADLQGVPYDERPARYKELLDMTGLAPFTARPAGKLSGGMKQKLSLACALIHEPQLMLLDEPSAGVDPVSREELWKILQKAVHNNGISVLMSTAFLDEAALCNYVYVLNQGMLLSEGTPSDLCKSIDGRVWFAKADNSSIGEMLQKCEAQSEIIDASPSGDGLRILLTKETNSAEIRQKLSLSTMEPVEPSLEDAFMENLVSSSGKKQSFGEVTGNQCKTQKRSDQPVVVVNHLVKKFGNFIAVDDTSFSVKEGEIFGLLGPNGAGKTTTFRMLCGLLPATSGSLEVAGVDVRKARASARKNIGYVSQFFSLYGSLSVGYNLEFFAKAYGLNDEETAQRKEIVAKQFELENLLDRMAGSLNEGYKKRLSMAAALIHNPDILFLDEPTSSIDPLARRAFWLTINELAEQGKAIIITTHFMDEAEYCTRIAIQSEGKILALGTPSEVKTRAHLPQTASMNQAFLNIVLNQRETA